ncbi:hypothetical protein pipiens_003878 [Culex pipiens pipiens]|uniref:Uncharacterized protein n=1 Tax=Culex pipiens pipiens TaxID=38569 RepID=A0ABD1CRG6_CULPP
MPPSGEANALCRVCAVPFEPSTMFRLFNERNDPLPIAEAFWRVSEIEIQVDDSRFPQSCCIRCRDRLQEVEDLRVLCLESDRKLRKMIDSKKEDGDIEMGDMDAIAKVELVETNEPESFWDDMEERFESSEEESESEDLPGIESSRRSSHRMKSEMKLSDEQLKESDSDKDTNNGNDSDYDPDNETVKYKKRRGKNKPRKKREPKPPKANNDNIPPKEKPPRKPKSFQCPWCGRIFKESRNLREHETSHFPDRKNHKCPICSQEFARRNYYLRHMKMHQTENQFKCNECDKAFSFEKQLQEHIGVTHRRERSHQCKQCPKTYLTAAALYSHVQAIHKQNFRFKCDVCFRSFLTSTDLERHKDRHRGIKKSACPHCDNKYESNNYLRQHIAERHPETLEKLSRCQYCGLGYNTNSHYRQHVAKKHPEHLTELDQWLKAKRGVVVQPAPAELEES